MSNESDEPKKQGQKKNKASTSSIQLSEFWMQNKQKPTEEDYEWARQMIAQIKLMNNES